MNSDLGNLATLRLDDPTEQDAVVPIASMPEDLWRKVCAFLRPATSAQAFVVAAGRNASLRQALQAEVAQIERSLFGMTRAEAEDVLRYNVSGFGYRFAPREDAIFWQHVAN